MDGEREEAMRGTYKIRRAAKEHRCSEQSYHTIKAGDLYLCGSCPPEHDMNGSRKWLVLKACLRCAEEFGLHSSETRAQLLKARQMEEVA